MTHQKEKVASLIQKGLDLLNSGKLQAAKELFTQICESNPQEVEAWCQLGIINGRIGAFDQAAECCRRLFNIQPDHCEGRVILGDILYSQGKIHDAIKEYQQVIKINPDHAIVYCKLGTLFAGTGNYNKAEVSYQTAIKHNPNLFIAFYGLGSVRLAQELYDKAANCYKRAIQLNPNDAQSHNCLGIALTNLGRIDEASASFRDAIRLNGNCVDAFVNLGNLYSNMGNQSEALATLQQALLVAPDSADIHNNLGSVYLEIGSTAQAIHCFQRALELNPLHVVALNNMAIACCSSDKFSLYLALYGKTIDLLPDPEQARRAFVDASKFINPSCYDSWLDRELIKCFSIPEVDYQSLASVTARHLRVKYPVALGVADNQNDLRSIVDQVASDVLFMMYLERTSNIDADLELLLCSIRSILLRKYHDRNGINRQELQMVCALAFQCFNNEYIFTVDPEEQDLLSSVKDAIETYAKSNGSPNAEFESNLCIYGMYERLYSLSCREQLSSMPLDAWSEQFYPLLEKTLIIPIQEEELKQEIATIGNIDDKTSLVVQSQYEENPYPRWLSIPDLKQNDIGRVLKQRFPHFSPPAFLDGPIDILVAGCGTGQQPILTALTYQNVEILAVDISKSSLAYAVRMARRYGIKNIHFMHGDILHLANLEKRFHIIECTGVLHHLEDPLNGWKILCDLLVDYGLMSIGLYSQKARKNIIAAREIIQREKLIPDIGNIREFRRRIMKHEMNDALYELCKSRDFYTTSACRDLLFHFKEHQFSIPELEKAFSDVNMEFVGFEFGRGSWVPNAFRLQHPQDMDMTNLALWDQFESRHPNAFARMYDFWCQKRA